jgi:hypothetical protein
MFAQLQRGATHFLREENQCALTQGDAFVCISRVKWLSLAFLLFAGTSCTTLENRRDLYRSPEEGYEQWYPQPPPTRKPASGPVPANAGPGRTTTERNGVITFPEEGLPESGR